MTHKLTQKDSFLFTSELAHLQFRLRNVLKERYHRMQRKEEALFQPDSCSLDMQLRKLTLSINQNLGVEDDAAGTINMIFFHFGRSSLMSLAH